MLELMRLDIRHSNNDFATWRFLKDAFEAYASEPVLPEPLVHGRDLIAWGVAPGPDMGRLLHELYDAQLEGQIATSAEAHDYFLKSGATSP
jgi:poly(A) polymerase